MHARNRVFEFGNERLNSSKILVYVTKRLQQQRVFLMPLIQYLEEWEHSKNNALCG